jgi:hypothetical protein
MTQINDHNLGAWKALNPQDKRLQGLILTDLLKNVDETSVDFSSLTFEGRTDGLLGDGLDCAESIGFVVFDCVCLFLGAATLRASATAEVAEDIAKAAEPVVNQLTQYIRTIGDASSSTYDVAYAVFKVISTIYSGGALGAVMGVFLTSLTWYNAILYGMTAVGTIMAALATDGAAEIGIIVVEIATAGFLISDSVACSKACNY